MDINQAIRMAIQTAQAQGAETILALIQTTAKLEAANEQIRQLSEALAKIQAGNVVDFPQRDNNAEPGVSGDEPPKE